MSRTFRGIWPALLTPLDDTGELAESALEQLVELFVKQRLGGLYILGTTGQWPLLTIEQRQRVAVRVVRTAAGRIPVIVHVGAVATADAVLLAKHAAAIGADAVSSVAPIYYPASADVLFEHYRRIGAATDLPLFVYHLFLANQPPLPAREYAARLLELPNIAGMKFTDFDLYQLGLIHSHTEGKLQIFSGIDEVLCHAALSGAIGAIGTFFNLWGPACQQAREAFVNGSFETGRRFMLTFQGVLGEVLGRKSMWGFLRAAIRLKYGIDIGMPRPPVGLMEKPWTDAEVARLVERVDASA